MSNLTDFNRIDNCNKISPDCIDAYFDYKIDPEHPEKLCIQTSWGGECLDLTPLVKATETLTTLYLSPETDPNCLVYEPERGDNICISGDNFSRIISMQYLKDVDQTTPLTNGDVYIYNSTTNQFEPFNLGDFVTNYNTVLTNLQAQLNQILNRITPPDDAPDNVSIVFGNINLYSDPNVVINEGSGSVTTLDKNHGLYTHLLSEDRYADEIFG